MAIEMTNEQYELLLSYGYGQRTDLELLRDVQRRIDEMNEVRRYYLAIRWMETGGSAPSRIEIGKGWPPTQTAELRMNRPITRTDVDTVLSKQARNPVYVTVTPDEAKNVGWTELDSWSF